jgi:transcriptional regulator with XRE-family HTH domain
VASRIPRQSSPRHSSPRQSPPRQSPPRQSSPRHGELGRFLRARRADLTPADVGLVSGSASGLRRTPGLRREEVAQLSGVGVTWYTWLEQGRDISVSAQVVDALARALLLSPDQHRYLRDLAGLPRREPPVPADGCHARLQLLVDTATPSPASVYDEHFDYVVWNEAYARVRHDPATLPADRRNMVWMMFTDEANRARMRGWESAARAVLSQFRVAAGRHPGDPRFAELIGALTEVSQPFRDGWAEYPVRYFRPATIAIQHPRAGLISLQLFQLRLVDQPGLVAVIQAPATQKSLSRVQSLLAGDLGRQRYVSRPVCHGSGGNVRAYGHAGELPVGSVSGCPGCGRARKHLRAHPSRAGHDFEDSGR